MKHTDLEKRDWEERFDTEFKATGAEIVGFKRHEYSQLREHQYEQVKAFISKEREEAYRRGREDAVEFLKRHIPEEWENTSDWRSGYLNCREKTLSVLEEARDTGSKPYSLNT